MEENYYYLMALFDEKTNDYFHLLKNYIDLPANPSSIFTSFNIRCLYEC